MTIVNTLFRRELVVLTIMLGALVPLQPASAQDICSGSPQPGGGATVHLEWEEADGGGPPWVLLTAVEIRDLPAACSGKVARIDVRGNDDGDVTQPATMLLSTGRSDRDACTGQPVPGRDAHVTQGKVRVEFCTTAGGLSPAADVELFTAFDVSILRPGGGAPGDPPSGPGGPPFDPPMPDPDDEVRVDVLPLPPMLRPTVPPVSPPGGSPPFVDPVTAEADVQGLVLSAPLPRTGAHVALLALLSLFGVAAGWGLTQVGRAGGRHLGTPRPRADRAEPSRFTDQRQGRSPSDTQKDER